MTFEVEKTPTFSLTQTLNCGQVFRFREEGGGTVMYAGAHRAEVREKEGFYLFDCDDAAFFKKYLDFDTNYDIIQMKVQDKGLIGAGYRAPYLVRTAKALADVDLKEWSSLPTPDLRARLTALHGVGRKVADCVLLFGFNRFDVFPVDTWIRKVFEPRYGDMPAEKLSETLVAEYGELSGFVQQWLFYYKREEKNAAKV